MFTVREPEDTSIKDAKRDELIDQHWKDLKCHVMTSFRSKDENRYIISSEIMHEVICEMSQPALEYDIYNQPEQLIADIKEAHKKALQSEMDQAIKDFYYD